MSLFKTHTTQREANMLQPNECLLHLRTTQSVKIRTLVETINPILVEGSINFDENGMHLSGINQIILCDFTIRAKDVEEYHCHSPQQISINFEVLYSCMSSVSQDESICLQITRESMDCPVPYLSVFIINGCNENEYIFHFKVTLLALAKEVFDIPETNFTSVVSIPSQSFHRVLRACDKRGSNVQVCTRYQSKSNNYVIFHTRGDESDLTYHMKMFVPDDPWIDKTCLKMDRYSLKYLLLISKATSMSTHVTLFLAPDFVLAVKYNIGTIGSVTFCLAPLVDKSDFIPPLIPSVDVTRVKPVIVTHEDQNHADDDKTIIPNTVLTLVDNGTQNFKRKRRRKKQKTETQSLNNNINVQDTDKKDCISETIINGDSQDLDDLLRFTSDQGNL